MSVKIFLSPKSSIVWETAVFFGLFLENHSRERHMKNGITKITWLLSRTTINRINERKMFEKEFLSTFQAIFLFESRACFNLKIPKARTKKWTFGIHTPLWKINKHQILEKTKGMYQGISSDLPPSPPSEQFSKKQWVLILSVSQISYRKKKVFLRKIETKISALRKTRAGYACGE